MSLETKFSKSEVKFLYRAFKTECPNGIIDEDTFKEVYEKIFPMGDASKYAQIVFRAIDRDRTGGITFGDFMDFLSIISKGSEQEKILWSFQFFDVNQDGKITREEMIKVHKIHSNILHISGFMPMVYFHEKLVWRVLKDNG